VGRRDADLLQNLDLPETFIALVLPHLNRDRLGHPALAVLELLAVSQTLHAVIILALCFVRAQSNHIATLEQWNSIIVEINYTIDIKFYYQRKLNINDYPKQNLNLNPNTNLIFNSNIILFFNFFFNPNRSICELDTRHISRSSK
jgi:hypothetical protein